MTFRTGIAQLPRENSTRLHMRIAINATSVDKTTVTVLNGCVYECPKCGCRDFVGSNATYDTEGEAVKLVAWQPRRCDRCGCLEQRPLPLGDLEPYLDLYDAANELSGDAYAGMRAVEAYLASDRRER